MKHNRNPLASAIRFGLGASVLASLAMTAAPVVAQDEEEETETLDRVQVTGSRIARVDIEGASPVTIVERADIERIGLNDIGEVLRQLPAITGGPLSTATNNGGDGSSLTSLRGMSPARTLVLINGRRQNAAGDFSTLPVAAIERVEVLKEGASAIYGADAVAGVVNIITRRDFDGVTVAVQYGASFETETNPAGELRDRWKGTDGEVGRFSIVLGETGNRGGFVAGLERSKQNEVYQGNLEGLQFRNVVDPAPGQTAQFLQDGFPRCLETGTCVTTGGSSASLGGFFNVPGDNGGFFTRDLDTGAIRPFDGSRDLYNYAPVNFLQQPFTRTSAFFNGEYDLFDNVNFFMEARWANRRSEQELAPTPLFIGIFDPGAPTSRGPGVPANNAFNPFGEDLTDVRRRVAEGGRFFQQDVVRTQVNAGLRGDFGQVAPSWTWDAAVTWGRTNQIGTDFGQFVGQNFTQAIGPSFFDDDGVAVCGTPESPIAGCVPMNVFGGFGTITPEMLEFAGAELIDRLDTTLMTIGGSVQGEVFDLPGGPLGLALGYEFRENKLNSIPDSGKATDSVTGNTFGKTEGKFDVNSVFAEINAPILSGRPGIELLEFGAGVRYDDFSTVGDNTVFMLNGRWKPHDDLLIRASYSEVFREPTIGDLFSPQGDSFPSFIDPCSNGNISDADDNRYAELTPEQQARCRATGVPEGGFFQTNAQPRARVGGNPDLAPEEGDTRTIGLAYSPSQIPGLSFTVDYWEIDLDDPIGGVGAQAIMDQCIARGQLEFCDLITRQGAEGNPGEVQQILSLALNAGNQTAKGIDFEAAYQFNTDFGMFNVRTQWTYLDERSGFILPENKIDVAGHFLDSDREGLNEAIYPEWKGLTTIDWTFADFGASINWEYLDSVTDIANDQSVPRVMYFDFTGRYNTPWGTRVSAGITNAFNTSPPFIFNAFNASTDVNSYRMLGRSWFVNLSHSF